MDWVEIAGYLCAVMVGVVIGILGGGGSVLAVPVLVYLFKLDVVTATAYSLLIVGCSAILAAVMAWQKKLLNLKVFIWFGVPSMVTVFFVRYWLIAVLPEEISVYSLKIFRDSVLLILFAILMLISSISMFIKSGNTTTAKKSTIVQNNGMLVPFGVVTGFLSGLVGAGGGFIIIPVLVRFAGLRMKMAVGTAMLIIAMQSLAGVAGSIHEFSFEQELPFVFTLLSLIGVLLGMKLSDRFSGMQIRRFFGVFVLVTGVFILLQEWFQ
jgi:uncharacterized membrane protein YfcA